MADRVCPDRSAVEPTDPAVRFIAANALKDLADFTFERVDQYQGSPMHPIACIAAFNVIDYDRHRQITLDTADESMRDASVPIRNEVLRALFSQVPSRTVSKLDCHTTS